MNSVQEIKSYHADIDSQLARLRDLNYQRNMTMAQRLWSKYSRVRDVKIDDLRELTPGFLSYLPSISEAKIQVERQSTEGDHVIYKHHWGEGAALARHYNSDAIAHIKVIAGKLLYMNEDGTTILTDKDDKVIEAGRHHSLTALTACEFIISYKPHATRDVL